MTREEREQLIDEKREVLTELIVELIMSERISPSEAHAITNAIEEVVHQERMSVHEMNDRAYARIARVKTDQ